MTQWYSLWVLVTVSNHRKRIMEKALIKIRPFLLAKYNKDKINSRLPFAFVKNYCIIAGPCKCTDSHRTLFFIEESLEGVRAQYWLCLHEVNTGFK